VARLALRALRPGLRRARLSRPLSARGPLRDTQLLRIRDHRILTRCHAHGSPAATSALDPQTWLRRYLEHAPVTGPHSLRRYGLYAPAARSRRLCAYTLVTPDPVARPRRFANPPKPIPYCPRCAQPLGFVQPGRPTLEEGTGEVAFAPALSVGDTWLLTALWQELGFAQVFRRLLRNRRQFDAEKLLRVRVFNRLCDPESQLGILR